LHKNRTVRKATLDKTFGFQRDVGTASWRAFCAPPPRANIEQLNSSRQEKAMGSELITYGLLASIFIVNGLRMFIEKPRKAFEVAERRWQGLKRRQEPRSGSTDS
jgi:hypothetical protein